MLLTMMVQSAEPLYSLFLWRQKKKKDITESYFVGWSFPVDLHLMITTCDVHLHVCVLLPLDAQSQYDAIMTLEGFLTLVGGAGVPYLRERNHHIHSVCVHL